MAITAPTPPTPPTVPVVPGAESNDNAAGSVKSNTGNGTDDGREFGVHVTISNPQQTNGEDKAVQQQGSTQNQSSTATQQGQQAAQGQDGGSDVAQQARQDMVQQALGMKDGNDAQAETQENVQQPVAEAPWSNMSAMSFMPVLIVFVAAFITFFLRNMSKKPPVNMPLRADKQRTAGKENKKTRGTRFETRI